MNIGFLGFGNIAKAAHQGFTNKKIKMIDQMYATSLNYAQLKEEAKAYNIKACRNNEELVEACDLIFLCVKPKQVKHVLEELDLKDKIIVSFVAGLFHDDLEELIPETHHISVIPNTAMSVNKSVLLVENKNTLTQEQEKTVNKLLSKLGMIEYMDEDEMEIATAIAGCGPAFVAMFIEALGDAGCRFGLTRETSYRLASKMMEGTAKMMLDTKQHPAVLKDAVCSPNGSTIKGVCELEEEGFRGAIIEAISEIMD